MGYLLLTFGILVVGAAVVWLAARRGGKPEAAGSPTAPRPAPRAEKEQMDAPQEEFIDDNRPPSAGAGPA